MKIKILIIAVVLAGMLLSLSASAQTGCPGEETTDPACFIVDMDTASNRVYNGEIPKFDSSLGTLASVRLTAGVCVASTVEIDSDTQFVETWHIISRGCTIVTPPVSDQLQVCAGTPAEGIEVVAEPDDYPIIIVNGTEENPVCEEDYVEYTAATDLAIFSGNAGDVLPVQLRLLADMDVGNANGSSYDAMGAVLASGEVCVVYTYCPLPDVCISGSILDAFTGNPLEDWTVTLQDEAGAVVDTKTTDANGLYSFCILEPGSYTICEEQRYGWSPIGPTCYDIELIDEDVQLPAFENTQSSCISGHIYNGATDEGLSGWTIQLKENGAVIDTTTTGTDGYYEFCGLLPGIYQVCEVLKTGWTAVSDRCISVDLESEDSTENDFRNDIAPPCSSWSLKNDLYVAKCGELKVVDADRGLLANDRSDRAIVVDTESIAIDPRYGTIKVNEDGSFEYDAADDIRNGAYVIFRYMANNGMCNARYPGIAKIQVRCSC